MSNARQEGYYFVRMSDTDGNGWEVAKFSDGNWSIFNGIMTLYNDDYFLEIDERPIIRYDQIPNVLHIKKGLGFERHLLENYYVALPPLPIPNAETIKWVTIEKGASNGPTGSSIDPILGYLACETPQEITKLLDTPSHDGC